MLSVPKESEPQPTAPVHAGKYLTFKLGEEECGLEILKVQETGKRMDITTVLRTPASVRGVVNLHGKVIPVTDLRITFGMQEKENTEMTASLWSRSREERQLSPWVS